MNRRGFIRSALAGLALTIAAPVLARRRPDFLDQMRAAGCKWLGVDRASGPDMTAFAEWRELPPPRGSMIRFRRDPSRVFEL